MRRSKHHRPRSLAKYVLFVLTVGLVAVLASPALVGAGNPAGPDLEGGQGGDAECEQVEGLEFLFGGKTTGGQVAEGTYNIPGGGTITIENGDPGFINFVSTVPVVAIIVVKGNEPNTVTTFPGVLSGTAATNALLDGEDSPSHITFCFGEEQPPPNGTTPPNGTVPPPDVRQPAPQAPAPVTAAPRFTG